MCMYVNVCTNIKHVKDAINFHYYRISLVMQIVVGIKQRYRNYTVPIRLNIPSARKPLPITCPPRITLSFSPNPQNSGIQSATCRIKRREERG